MASSDEEFSVDFNLLERLGLWWELPAANQVYGDIAKLMQHHFKGETIVVSELAAGLVLMFKHHKKDPVAGDKDQLANKTYRPVLHRGLEADLHWDSIKRVYDTMLFAEAAYKITDDEPWYHKVLPKSFYTSVDQRNKNSLLKTLPHLEPKNLLYISSENETLQVPFFVAVDTRYENTIVLSIRGTKKMPDDALTDLDAAPGRLDKLAMDQVDGDLSNYLSNHQVAAKIHDPSSAMEKHLEKFKGFTAHEGMIKAARFVYTELMNESVLEDIARDYPGYRLIVTGHSLGAGTAVLLSFLLQQRFPDVRCVAISPPGGLLNKQARAASEDFTLSVTLGQDIVGRISIESFKDLKARAEVYRELSNKSTYRILHGTFWTNKLFSAWDWMTSCFPNTADRVFVAEGNAPAAMSLVPEKDPARMQACISPFDERLMLPGRIWHVETFRPEDKSNVRVVGIRERPAEYFKDIIVGREMIENHFIKNVKAMLKLIKDKKPEESDHPENEGGAAADPEIGAPVEAARESAHLQNEGGATVGPAGDSSKTN